MSHVKSKISRRNFLLAVGAGSAATAAAVAAKLTSQARISEKREGGRRGKGYRETAHIRNYYRTTQV